MKLSKNTIHIEGENLQKMAPRPKRNSKWPNKNVYESGKSEQSRNPYKCPIISRCKHENDKIALFMRVAT